MGWTGRACEMPKKSGGKDGGDYRVTPTGDGDWRLRRDGSERSSGIFDTQGEAADRGRGLARDAGVDLVIHGRDGKIRSKDSYGNDPNPPKDREH